MKIRDYKLHTYKVCNKWLRNKTNDNKKLMINNLNRWIRIDDGIAENDYGYEAKNLNELCWCVSYCSDRMNQGRAKALIRLLKEFGD